MDIGVRFRGLLDDHGLDAQACPVVAATWDSAASAVGVSLPSRSSEHLTLLLARAVARFHRATDHREQLDALKGVHRITLSVAGCLQEETYDQYITQEGIQPRAWRPTILAITTQLRPDSDKFADASAWLTCARRLLADFLPPDSVKSIGQRLINNKQLGSILGLESKHVTPPRTIHAVKGHQFPAVCVVMTANSSKRILDYLETDGQETEEDARKLYVAVSRAEQLLVIAVPKSQSDRLKSRLESCGARVAVTALAKQS